MSDPRYQELANLLVRYSTRIKKGEVVQIDAIDIPDDFVVVLIREIRKAGGIPLVETYHPRVRRELVRELCDAGGKLMADLELARMKKLDAYIGLRGSANTSEMSDVPSVVMQKYAKISRPALDQRVNHTKWVVLRWPTPSMAQSAGMSTEAFEDFYFRACTFDYSKFKKGAEALRKRLDKGDKVRIISPGTDLRFSIKGIGSLPCIGEFNIPDGEVFTAPVKDSVEGTIAYNTPSVYLGTKYENVVLTFKKGKIVEYSGSPQKKLDGIFGTDAGARYIGEFAIGFHPEILSPMGDILFDEKIAGSIHFTPGASYEVAGNGNKSAVHWDMVLIQRKDFGGGELWIDGECIRRDGIFLPKDLRSLNRENLLQK
jgi:aminopeptidase